MSYPSNPNQIETPAAPTSLLNSSADLIERLGKLSHRIACLGDSLLGAEPTPIQGTGKESEPSPAVLRNLNRCHAFISECENLLTRIEKRV
jgi:hypothetical protein